MKELNLKQEKFCQAYVMYRNATEAAKAAGYSDVSAHTQGHRLKQRPEINERIEELEKELETRIDVIAEVENQYNYAKSAGHTNSAIKALEVLSRIRSTKEEEAVKSIAELEQEIVNSLEILGEDRASKMFLKCSWFSDEDDDEEHDDC
jgi:phage terminase small subunit